VAENQRVGDKLLKNYDDKKSQAGYILALMAGTKQQDEIVEKITGQLQAAGLTEQVLIENDDFRLLLIVRSGAQEAPAEKHEKWHDLSVYLKGVNEMMAEGILKAATESKKGEWIGGVIEGGRKIHIKAGDRLLVPAGTPHRNSFKTGTIFAIAKIRVGREKRSPLGNLAINWAKTGIL